MRRYFCDRCGTEVAGRMPILIPTKKNVYDVDSVKHDTILVELCPTCCGRLNEIIEAFYRNKYEVVICDSTGRIREATKK